MGTVTSCSERASTCEGSARGDSREGRVGASRARSLESQKISRNRERIQRDGPEVSYIGLLFNLLNSKIKKRRKLEVDSESKSQPVISNNDLEINQVKDGDDQVMHEVIKDSAGNAFKMEDDFADYTEAE
jgi:hypothetical protein